jgi:hypothetical protein
MIREPHPEPHAFIKPPRQQSEVKQLHGRLAQPYPPVWGTAQPLKGASGIVRRRALHHPEYRARRWLLLMLADRMDVWEHRLGRAIPLLALAGTGFVLARSQSPRALRASRRI